MSARSVSPQEKSLRTPQIRVAGNIDLPDELKTVLREMFSRLGKIVIEAEFGRGLSGSRAFRVRLFDQAGQAHVPTVVKIAPLSIIQTEWAAYRQWVEDKLPNIARLEVEPTFPAGSLWGGLHYALVGGGTFEVASLHDYCGTAPADEVNWVLERRLFEIMGPNWWLDNRANKAYQMQADYDVFLPVNLLLKFEPAPRGEPVRLVEAGQDLPRLPLVAGERVALRGFVVVKVDLKRQWLTLNVPAEADTPWRESFRVRVTEVPNIAAYRLDQVLDAVPGQITATRHDQLVGYAAQSLGAEVNLEAERLNLSHEVHLPNPMLAYQGLLQKFLTVNIGTVHGDLNLENVLVDPATREVSLIDFATVRQGHVLHDLLRLETEVVIRLLPQAMLAADLPVETIFSFYERLHRVTHQPGQAVTLGPTLTGLEKPFKMIVAIRNMARKCLFNADDWREYYQGLILYLLGALKYKTLTASSIAPLPGKTAFWGAATIRHLLETSGPQPPRSPGLHPPNSDPLAGLPAAKLEPPYGTMRPDSKFYIERVADDHCWQHLAGAHAATLFVQAPMQMGKSSLMRRVLDRVSRVRQQPAAFVDFQQFTEQLLQHEENFFIEFCLMIGDALGIPDAIDQIWAKRRTNIVNCSRYLSDYIIPRVAGPFVLAMDEVERMQTAPFRANFFGMLRTWHNNRVYEESFAKMTLFLSSSTDPYLLIDNPHQSPFNVATLIPLEDFSIHEVRELNRRHDTLLTPGQVNALMDLVNGHPFLTRLAFYQLSLGKIDMPTLLAQAADDAGPFGDHLRHYLLRVLNNPELRQALGRIVHDHTYKEDAIFYRLKGAGLVRKNGTRVTFRNNLYERYFKERLNG